MSDQGNDVKITASTFPLAVLRHAATFAAAQTSVGEVAARIGIGRTTLRNFIVNLRTPHPKNRRKIAVWYHREGRELVERGEVDERLCEALLWAIPADQRLAAVKDMVEFVHSLHRTHGVPVTGPAPEGSAARLP